MNTLHHPSDDLLGAFAAGTLDCGHHVVVGTHVGKCARCARWTRSIEFIGGALLEALPPAAMSDGALESVRARLSAPKDLEEPLQTSQPAVRNGVTGLPEFLQRYLGKRWRWIAPSLYMLPIHLPEAGDARLFLLKAKPGTKLLPHTHAGTEMTSVLSGSFTHGGGRYGVGDFDFGDSDVSHNIAIGTETDCICLVAMRGNLRIEGVLGRLVQPFVSI